MVTLYIGSSITHESERSVLQRIITILNDLCRPAVILANVTVASRQIDFVVGFDNSVLVIEAKSWRHPIRGGHNGPWQIRSTWGKWEDLETSTNPYIQARDAKYALLNELKKFESKNIQYPHAAVVFTPDIPKGSEVNGDFKVSIIAIDDLETLIRNLKQEHYSITNWDSFAKHLKLKRISSVQNAYDPKLLDSDDLLQRYCAAFLRDYSRTHQLVPFACLAGGQDTSSDTVIDLIVDDRKDIFLQGPSGCGKTLLTKHAAVRFTKSGGVAIVVSARDYSRNLGDLLNREIGLLVHSSAKEVLDAASRLCRPILVAVDGLNECERSEQKELLRGIGGLATRYQIGLVVSSQYALNNETHVTFEIIDVPVTTMDTKVDIVKSLTGTEVLESRVEDLLRVVTTGLEARIAGEVGLEFSPNSSRFALFDCFVRKLLDGYASEGIRLLSKIAGRLTDNVSFSMTLRDFERLIGDCGISADIATRLRDGSLLVSHGDRVHYVHELFFDFFAAEDVVRRAVDQPDRVTRALASPRYAKRKEFILGAIDNETMLDAVLDQLEDSDSVNACLSGISGIRAQEWAESQCLRLLEWELHT